MAITLAVADEQKKAANIAAFFEGKNVATQPLWMIQR